ncbi:MAG: zf-TFIIB domain-containing protein [Verrucomicrobiales bacterium]|nr:zf-TFIIB domain-containing protein [Verrucomicrobiales bacterium]
MKVNPAKLSCPRCTSGLRTVLYEGVEIETCPVCQGEWLDEGELQLILDRVEQRFDPAELDVLDAVNRSLPGRRVAREPRLECPKCAGQTLNPFTYAGSTGIVLDKCAGCGGIWLDHNELEMVQAVVEGCRRRCEAQLGSGSRLAGWFAEEPHPGGERPFILGFGFVVAVLRRFRRRD